MPADIRFHTLYIARPHDPGFDGDRPEPYLAIDRGLKGGRLDRVPLDEEQLVALIEKAAGALRQLREHDRRPAATRRR